MTEHWAVLQNGLMADVMARGLGQLYSIEDVLALAGHKLRKDDWERAVAERAAAVHFQGGNSGVPVQPGTKRKAILHRIDHDLYCWDSEYGVQAGLEHWLKQQGYLVRQEFPDKPALWRQISQHPAGLNCLQPVGPNEKAPTASRDLVAHHPARITTSVEIWEVKGKTAVDSDLYETFGQLFPVADATVTKGWTIKKVPKHGKGLEYARLLSEAWGPAATVHIAVAIPDFPPAGWALGQFYSGPSLYYPRQVRQFMQFTQNWETPGSDTFSRLLAHLRDEYCIQQMMLRAGTPIGFRFVGYQGPFVRDFAANLPLAFP